MVPLPAQQILLDFPCVLEHGLSLDHLLNHPWCLEFLEVVDRQDAAESILGSRRGEHAGPTSNPGHGEYASGLAEVQRGECGHKLRSDEERCVEQFRKIRKEVQEWEPLAAAAEVLHEFRNGGDTGTASDVALAGLLDGIWKAQALLKCSGNMECHLQLAYGFGDGVRRVGRHLYKVGKLWDGFFNGCCKNDPTPSLFDCLPGWVGLRNGAVIALGALDAGLETAEKGDTVAPRKAQEACRSGNPCMHMFM